MSVTLDVVGSGRKLTLNLPEPKSHVLHEVVSWQLAKRRRGTAATKTRGKVVGSTAKIYPQKGTGRARHGSRKAPIFVGGGTVFGPQPRDYSYSLPKRVRKLGLSMAIAARANDNKLTLVDSFSISGKTKEFIAWAKDHGFDGSERVLLVTDDAMVRRAARNVPWVNVLAAAGMNVYDILRHEHLIADASLFEAASRVDSEGLEHDSTTQAGQVQDSANGSVSSRVEQAAQTATELAAEEASEEASS